MRTRAVVGALLALILASPIGAHDEPVPGVVAFVPLPTSSPSHLATPGSRPGVRSGDGAWSGGAGSRPPRPVRPIVHVPDSPVIVVSRGAGGATTPSGARTVSGPASWFCGHGSACTHGYPGGLYAAAGPSLRVGHWRGRVVNVRAGLGSVSVTLIDWCACPGGRLLDLYSDAFLRLAPLSRGLVRVTVTW